MVTHRTRICLQGMARDGRARGMGGGTGASVFQVRPGDKAVAADPHKSLGPSGVSSRVRQCVYQREWFVFESVSKLPVECCLDVLRLGKYFSDKVNSDNNEFL